MTSNLAPPAKLQSDFFRIESGLTFHLASVNRCAPTTLVLLHALGCDWQLWAPLFEYLGAHIRCYALDLRGHGLSDCGPPECSIDDFARDLVELLDRLDLRRVSLAGVSVGGLIALAAARLAPERIERMVLCATGARIGTPALWSQRIADVTARGLPAMAPQIVNRWFAPDFVTRETALVQGCHNGLCRQPVTGYTATCAALRDADLTAALPSLATPALVLSGTADVAAPPEVGRALATGLPAARFVSLDGIGHLPPLECPGQLANMIESFLAEK